MTRAITWTDRSRGDMRRLDPQVAQRIGRAVTRFAETGQGDVKKLQGPASEWRLRVGDWRVRFAYTQTGGAIEVLRVLHRGHVYRQ